MRRTAQRQAGYAFTSVDIVYLERDAAPPDDERYLIFEWARSGAGCRIERERHGLRYVVAPDKHAFWLGEARHMARRLQLERVYYRGAPTFGDERPVAKAADSEPERD